MTQSSATSWAIRELGTANFNDDRLTQRGVALASSLLEHPHCSLPQACQSWSATKGAYRFFANDKATSDKMLESHHQQLKQRIQSYDVILVAQDTSTLNLSSKHIAGAGSIGDGGKSGSLTGLYAHTSLAMSPDGVPLGITDQKVYARKDETKTVAYRKSIKSKPITEKETYRWIEAIQHTKEVLPSQRIVMIGDRESDIYEVFQQGHELGVKLLVRTSQNRLLTEAGTSAKLFDVARRGDIITTYETDVPIDAHKTRKAMLTIRSSPIQLSPPKSRDRGKDRASIALTILNVAEESPAAGVVPLHWMLTTSLSVTTPAEAIEKVTWYIYRWRIERFYYTLKTGAFNIEKLQFETADRFKKAITLYSLVAARLLQVLYYERDHPDEPASVLFSAQEMRALRLREKTTTLELNCHEAVVATAKLGGYLARNRDGPPGIKALWKGFNALQFLVEGMLLVGDVGKD